MGLITLNFDKNTKTITRMFANDKFAQLEEIAF